MSLKTRLAKLEQGNEKTVDVATILNEARNRCARGEQHPPRTPTPPEWEHSRNPLAQALLAARRRVGG